MTNLDIVIAGAADNPSLSTAVGGAAIVWRRSEPPPPPPSLTRLF